MVRIIRNISKNVRYRALDVPRPIIFGIRALRISAIAASHDKQEVEVARARACVHVHVHARGQFRRRIRSRARAFLRIAPRAETSAYRKMRAEEAGRRSFFLSHLITIIRCGNYDN